MIWQADSAGERDREALRNYVADTLRSHLHEDDVSPPQLTAVADAVSFYYGDGKFPPCVHDTSLWLAVSRALCAIGCVTEAEQFLRNLGDEQHPLALYLPLLRVADLPAPVWRVCAARGLRPRADLAGRLTNGWVVDLRGRAADAEGFLELACERVLRTLLRTLALLWDHTDGQGFVGLLGLESAGVPGKRGEWLAYGRAVVEQEQARRGWSNLPEVLALDLPGSSGKRRTIR